MAYKWLAVVGSPRKGRNTDLLVDYVIEGLEEKNIQVEKIYLSSTDIATCKGCEQCIKTGTCGIRDSVAYFMEWMKQADGFVFASPTYNYNMTAQMKAFLDRTFCLNDYTGSWKSRLSGGKKAIIIGACAGREKDSMGFTVEGMQRCISELGIQVVDTIEYFDTKRNPVEKNKEIQETIFTRINKNPQL